MPYLSCYQYEATKSQKVVGWDNKNVRPVPSDAISHVHCFYCWWEFFGNVFGFSWAHTHIIHIFSRSDERWWVLPALLFESRVWSRSHAHLFVCAIIMENLISTPSTLRSSDWPNCHTITSVRSITYNRHKKNIRKRETFRRMIRTTRLNHWITRHNTQKTDAAIILVKWSHCVGPVQQQSIIHKSHTNVLSLSLVTCRRCFCWVDSFAVYLCLCDIRGLLQLVDGVRNPLGSRWHFELQPNYIYSLTFDMMGIWEGKKYGHRHFMVDRIQWIPGSRTLLIDYNNKNIQHSLRRWWFDDIVSLLAKC